MVGGGVFFGFNSAVMVEVGKRSVLIGGIRISEFAQSRGTEDFAWVIGVACNRIIGKGFYPVEKVANIYKQSDSSCQRFFDA